MNKDYSLDALNKFLDYILDKGLLKPETAKSRKVAVNKILVKLSPEEQGDLRQVNLDDQANRFANLNGADYLPTSMQVYKSRVKSALSDFFLYVDNPMTFRPSAASRAVSKPSGGGPKRAASNTSGAAVAPSPGGLNEDQRPPAATPLSAHDHLVFPIPIRPGLVVKLTNIPSDLTAGEAEKIAQVVKALACNE